MAQDGGKLFDGASTHECQLNITLTFSFFALLHEYRVMEHGFYYEKMLTADFVQVLKESPPGARVLDVGGEFGLSPSLWRLP